MKTLNEQTMRVVRDVVLEAANRRYKTRLSSRVNLSGPKTGVSINPTLKDTQTMKDTGAGGFKRFKEVQEILDWRRSLLDQAKGAIESAHKWVKQNNQSAVVFHDKEKRLVTFRSKKAYDQCSTEHKKHHCLLKIIHSEE
jgi:hypothetical protein